MTLLLENITQPQDIHGASIGELENLAEQIRHFLIGTISETGGHIGANLGVVELSIALHACFNSPKDCFLFDTGHQGYTHKLLTGRQGLFASLNTYGGMNRFVTPSESEHDPIEASHAGTAISVGLGMALANKLSGSDDFVVATVGDSSLAEGISLEALNHALVEHVNLVIVINDNGFAISPGFGALHNALQSHEGHARKLFEGLGAKYWGPVDGHELGALTRVLNDVKLTGGVHIVHTKTVKGKGLAAADTHPLRMHFSFPFDAETGQARPGVAPALSYPDAVAPVIDAYMTKNERSVCITPSTLYATGFSPIFEKYPERCFDPGMEEQHALSMCVGFAKKGFIPIIGYQSTFLQRAFDQVIHDIAFANKPCLILSYRSGFSGYDNPTHHGIYDISFLQGVPNLNVYYPKDRSEALAMTEYCLDNLKGPTIIMMPYGPAEDLNVDTEYSLSKSVLEPECVLEGKDLAIVAVGNKIKEALGASELLQRDGIAASVINLRHIKPLPEDTLNSLLESHQNILSLEEAVEGGVGRAIAAMLFKQKRNDVQFEQRCLPVDFIEAGSNDELEKKYGLDRESLAAHIKQLWFSVD